MFYWSYDLNDVIPEIIGFREECGGGDGIALFDECGLGGQLDELLLHDDGLDGGTAIGQMLFI